MEDDATLPKAAKHPLELILDFVELADLPLSWTSTSTDQRDSGEDTSEEEEFDAKKVLGEAKACLINGVVAFSSGLTLGTLPLGFWTRMQSWLDNDVSDRRDLVECALLVYGNSINGGLSSPSAKDTRQADSSQILWLSSTSLARLLCFLE